MSYGSMMDVWIASTDTCSPTSGCQTFFPDWPGNAPDREHHVSFLQSRMNRCYDTGVDVMVHTPAAWGDSDNLDVWDRRTRCEWCGQLAEIDARGGCVTCGGPR